MDRACLKASEGPPLIDRGYEDDVDEREPQALYGQADEQGSSSSMVMLIVTVGTIRRVPQPQRLQSAVINCSTHVLDHSLDSVELQRQLLPSYDSQI